MPSVWAFGCLHFACQSWHFGEPHTCIHTPPCLHWLFLVSWCGFRAPCTSSNSSFPYALTSFFFFLFVRVEPRWVCTNFCNVLTNMSCDNSEMCLSTGRRVHNVLLKWGCRAFSLLHTSEVFPVTLKLCGRCKNHGNYAGQNWSL